MENSIPGPLLERNPITRQRHRREVLIQITIPSLVGAALLLILLFLSFYTGDSKAISQQADVSIIWLMVSLILSSFIILTLLLGMVYALVRVIGILPPYFKYGQDLFNNIRVSIANAGDRMVKPVLRLQEFNSYKNTILNKIKGR